jgi:hypothetical protein
LCVLAEFKYDGQRAQIHLSAEREVGGAPAARCAVALSAALWVWSSCMHHCRSWGCA